MPSTVGSSRIGTTIVCVPGPEKLSVPLVVVKSNPAVAPPLGGPLAVAKSTVTGPATVPAKVTVNVAVLPVGDSVTVSLLIVNCGPESTMLPVIV